MAEARIKTTVVGSYQIPDWLAVLPSEHSLIDANRATDGKIRALVAGPDLRESAVT